MIKPNFNLLPRRIMTNFWFTGSSPQTIHREQFTANNSPLRRFTAGQFTAEAIHRRGNSPQGNSPQGNSPQGNSPQTIHRNFF
jgi:hypothetical protein